MRKKYTNKKALGLHVGMREHFVTRLTAIGLLAGGLLVFLFISEQKKTIVDAYTEKGVALTENLAANSEYGFITADKIILNDLLKNLRRRKDVLYVVIAEKNVDSKIIASFNTAGIQLSAIKNVPAVTITKYLTDGKDRTYLDIVSPVTFSPSPFIEDNIFMDADIASSKPSAPKVVGYVRLGLSLSEQFKKMNATKWRNITFITVLMLIFSLYYYYQLTKAVIDPIKSFIKGAKEVRKGNLEHKVEASGSTEMVELTEEFNLAVAERKRAEDELRKARDELETKVEERTKDLVSANKELEEFNFVASHDLKEPLRTLSNYCELLRRDLGDSLQEPSSKYLKYIGSAAGQMRQLILDMLELSRLGKGSIVMTPVDMNKCMAKASENLKPLQEETNGVITWEKLPSVKGDSGQLIRVMQNITGNALKFCKERSPKVSVTSKQLNGAVQISITDNGIGMEPKYLNQIFQPFKRLHGKNQYEGSGIGLTICQRIIERHGGQITVTSECGKGSVFTITLPRLDSPQG